MAPLTSICTFLLQHLGCSFILVYSFSCLLSCCFEVCLIITYQNNSNAYLSIKTANPFTHKQNKF